jgi:hypothetical protein
MAMNPFGPLFLLLSLPVLFADMVCTDGEPILMTCPDWASPDDGFDSSGKLQGSDPK